MTDTETPETPDDGSLFEELLDDNPETDEGPDTVRALAHWVLEQMRVGNIWAGWTDDGRVAYGDTGRDPVPDGLVPEHLAEETALLAGYVAAEIIRQSVDAVTTPEPSKLIIAGQMPGNPPPNREARRSALRRR